MATGLFNAQGLENKVSALNAASAAHMWEDTDIPEVDDFDGVDPRGQTSSAAGHACAPIAHTQLGRFTGQCPRTFSGCAELTARDGRVFNLKLVR